MVNEIHLREIVDTYYMCVKLDYTASLRASLKVWTEAAERILIDVGVVYTINDPVQAAFSGDPLGGQLYLVESIPPDNPKNGVKWEFLGWRSVREANGDNYEPHMYVV